MKTLNLIRVALITVLILLIPLIAMQFSDEVVWDETDFIVAGVLLFSVGLALEFVRTRGGTSNRKIIFAVVIVVVFLLIWAELAVGVFGTPFAGS